MNYSDFEKYRTIEDREVDITMHTLWGGTKQLKMKMPVYRVGLGTLMMEFIKHLKIPKWRRGVEHTSVTNKFLDIFNQIETEWVD